MLPTTGWGEHDHAICWGLREPLPEQDLGAEPTHHAACWSQLYTPVHEGPVLGCLPTLEATQNRLM